MSALADWIKQKLVQIQTHNNQKKTSVYVEKCLKYMEQNYSKEITLEGTAEYVGVSSFYLTRLLRQELDRSFVKILIDIRMKNAVELLWRGELSAKEIGAAVGYPNPVYFSRVFKKNMGMTIRQLREYLQQEVVFAETDEEM